MIWTVHRVFTRRRKNNTFLFKSAWCLKLKQRKEKKGKKIGKKEKIETLKMYANDERCEVLAANRLELLPFKSHTLTHTHTRKTWNNANKPCHACWHTILCTLCLIVHISVCAHFFFSVSPYFNNFRCVDFVSCCFFFLHCSLVLHFTLFNSSRTPLHYSISSPVKSTSSSLLALSQSLSHFKHFPAFIVIFHLYRERYATLLLFYEIICVSICIARQ